MTLALAPIAPAELATRNQEAVRAVAPVVKAHYIKRIGDKDYLMVAGAQAIGSAMGYTCAVTATRYVQASDGLPGYWEAVAEVLLGTAVVGRGVSMVADDEAMWRSRPHFARQGMAQTRATGRALKGVIGWATALVGTETSLAEEMPAEAVGMPQERPDAVRALPKPTKPAKPAKGESGTVRTVRGCCAGVQEKVSKAGRKYWRVGIEAEDGATDWFTSFESVPDLAGRLIAIDLEPYQDGEKVADLRDEEAVL